MPRAAVVNVCHSCRDMSSRLIVYSAQEYRSRSSGRKRAREEMGPGSNHDAQGRVTTRTDFRESAPRRAVAPNERKRWIIAIRWLNVNKWFMRFLFPRQSLRS